MVECLQNHVGSLGGPSVLETTMRARCLCQFSELLSGIAALADNRFTFLYREAWPGVGYLRFWLYRDNGNENGDYYVVYWGCIGTMETKMETTL